MHDRMKKILSKKRDLSPAEHSAKMDVVKHMRDMASEEMGGKLDGLKKVSVMSNSPQGLKHGLDKAKNIVSNMDQMKNHAENDMGDDVAARQEHMSDEPNQDDGSEASFSDGGPVLDPNATQSAQDSMRKAFGYNEGGEVEESPDEDNSEEGYESRSEDESDESPEEEQEESPEDEAAEDKEDEFHGLDMDQLKDKLREMMQMHKSMGKKAR